MSDCTMLGIAIAQKRRVTVARPLEPTEKRAVKKRKNQGYETSDHQEK